MPVPRRTLLTLLTMFAPASAQIAELRPAPEVHIPFLVDGNSPALWHDNQLLFFTSDGNPVVGAGADQFRLGSPRPVTIDRADHLPMWIESVWQDADGRIYGWYHNEPGGVCPGGALTAPRIGAVVSSDGGRSFTDLGLILTSGDPVDCRSQNGFFAGGHGDFSVIADAQTGYFYFFFTNYGGDAASQGIAVARLAFEDRDNPAGAVFKFYRGSWGEPGLDGRLTPVFRARTSWQREDTNSFWGPAVHWNYWIERYVILLNQSCCEPGWPQAGISIAFSADLSDPGSWSVPYALLREVPWGPGYYPAVMGLDAFTTDSVAGKHARLYVHGRSIWEIVFSRPEEVPVPEPEEPEMPPGEPDYL